MVFYESITRAVWTDGGSRDEALHVADEVNCVQWIEVPREPRGEPFTAKCDEHGENHQWRTVWVAT